MHECSSSCKPVECVAGWGSPRLSGVKGSVRSTCSKSSKPLEIYAYHPRRWLRCAHWPGVDLYLHKVSPVFSFFVKQTPLEAHSQPSTLRYDLPLELPSCKLVNSMPESLLARPRGPRWREQTAVISTLSACSRPWLVQPVIIAFAKASSKGGGDLLNIVLAVMK